ncbi:unnamed protein product, partial [Ectocarpus sp. 12 AP-2014]
RACSLASPLGSCLTAAAAAAAAAAGLTVALSVSGPSPTAPFVGSPPGWLEDAGSTATSCFCGGDVFSSISLPPPSLLLPPPPRSTLEKAMRRDEERATASVAGIAASVAGIVARAAAAEVAMVDDVQYKRLPPVRGGTRWLEAGMDAPEHASDMLIISNAIATRRFMLPNT